MKKLNILLIGGTKDASNITKHIKEKYDSYILTTTTTEYGSKLAIESGSLSDLFFCISKYLLNGYLVLK